MARLPSSRQQQIIDRVQRTGFGAIGDFSAQFGVSEQTIRRDVNQLCEWGELRRVHGGVERPATGQTPRQARQIIAHEAEKRQIGALVARFVADGSSLAVLAGTTTELAMKALQGKSGLRIFTNSLSVALFASQQPDWSVSVAGGAVIAPKGAMMGSGADFFSRFEVDIGLFGAAGLSADGTLLDMSEEEAACRKAIMASSRASFLLLDHSKFGHPAHIRGGHLDEATRLFTSDAEAISWLNHVPLIPVHAPKPKTFARQRNISDHHLPVQAS
ncbi:MAG: DeoR/GlpR family DNA-binding transcription regulator [Cohaesibacter sp.]|jgi:DeoR family glycerol-3-phosphate regulon repressor|nr:DeoR/GlpR family DNA-binding transcription regulator [Cohaesibacter sp.]